MGRSTVRLCALAALVASAAAHAGDDALLKQAEQLLAQQQPKAALALLSPQEDQRAGEPDFDYLLGLSELESGDAAAAAFAFDRCLATDPKNGPCRVQMARTHLALGENASARRELTAIQDAAPPPEVAKMVAAYMGALQTAERSERRQLNGWAQAGIGYDSNINLANGSSAIELPGILSNFVGQVSKDAIKQASGFGQAQAGGIGHYKLNTSWSLLGDADVTVRNYPGHERFRYDYRDLNLGGAYQNGADQYLLKLQEQAYDLDGGLFRRVHGILAQFQRAVTADTTLSAYGSSSRIGYGAANAPFNSTRNLAGGAVSTALSAKYTPVAFVGAYLGSEIARDSTYSYNSQHFVGLRVGETLFYNQQISFNGSLAVENRNYDAVNVLFLKTRHDIQTDVSLGMVYTLSRGLSLRPGYTYTRSHSNIIVDKFGRNVLSVDLRYDM